MSTFYVIAEDELVGDVAVISVGGELDFAVSSQFRRRLFAQIESGRRLLLLDFTRITFVDSTAIGVIVAAVSRLRASGGGAVAVVCPGGEPTMEVAVPQASTAVRKVFQIAGLDAGVDLCASRHEALEHLSKAA